MVKAQRRQTVLSFPKAKGMFKEIKQSQHFCMGAMADIGSGVGHTSSFCRSSRIFGSIGFNYAVCNLEV